MSIPGQVGLQGEILDDFFAEADEHLKSIREGLAALEPSVGRAQPDLAVVEELFRHFHTFKGISAIVGLGAAEALAHGAEDFLRELTRGRASLSMPGLDLLMAAAQALERIVLGFRNGQDAPSIEGLLQSLKDAAGAERASAPNPESSSGAQLEEAEARGLVVLRWTFVPRPDLDQRGVNITFVRAKLSALGEILRAEPQVQGEGKVAFIFTVAMREAPADIAAWEADGITAELVERPGPPAAADGQASEASSEPVYESHNPFIAPSHVVRVDLNRLNELMRITGELVIQRSRFEEELGKSRRGATGLDVRNLQEVNAGFTRSLRQLREAIMRVRLVPVAEIFARMPFVVRDLGRDSRKKVRLRLEGQQTELDKYLIERLKDSLLHLVRNAFSHGIEAEEDRVAAGKPAEGNILLRAWTEGDMVSIQVQDDGRGIDAEAVARRAAAQGIAVPALLDLPALLEILCAPGFSTRDDADRVAGRGVGMSVVHATVRELGGTMTLESWPGKGTRFTLRLPLTLAIAEMFIVSAAGQTCALPQSYVREVMQVPADQIRVINRVEVAPYRSGVLPITRLSALFKAPGGAAGDLSLLVLSSDRGSCGLVVDRIHGQKEVVVQAMRDPLLQVPGVVGATELGNGRPVLILDGALFTSGPVRPHDLPAHGSAMPGKELN